MAACGRATLERIKAAGTCRAARTGERKTPPVLFCILTQRAGRTRTRDSFAGTGAWRTRPSFHEPARTRRSKLSAPLFAGITRGREKGRAAAGKACGRQQPSISWRIMYDERRGSTGAFRSSPVSTQHCNEFIVVFHFFLSKRKSTTRHASIRHAASEYFHCPTSLRPLMYFWLVPSFSGPGGACSAQRDAHTGKRKRSKPSFTLVDRLLLLWLGCMEGRKLPYGH